MCTNTGPVLYTYMCIYISEWENRAMPSGAMSGPAHIARGAAALWNITFLTRARPTHAFINCIKWDGFVWVCSWLRAQAATEFAAASCAHQSTWRCYLGNRCYASQPASPPRTVHNYCSRFGCVPRLPLPEFTLARISTKLVCGCTRPLILRERESGFCSLWGWYSSGQSRQTQWPLQRTTGFGLRKYSQ
jgi:hypothetical protein